MRAAGHLIARARTIEWNYDPVNESDIVFAIQPKGKDETGRRMPIAGMATDRIWEIISYAAAKAHVQGRISFYQTISEDPDFRGSAGKMFGRFFLSWLASGPDVNPLDCSPAKLGSSVLNIPACGEEQTSFFGSKTVLKRSELDDSKLPVCLLPISQTFAGVNAIIFTNEFFITVQVTISDKDGAKGIGFTGIKESISPHIREHRNWCHVFITDNDRKAESLRGQTLSDLPKDISVYSGVFHLDRITLAHLQAFDEKKVSGSHLKAGWCLYWYN
jgi:hypothetical protein